MFEEREVSWSRQHPSRTGPSRRTRCNHCSHDDLQQDLADGRMANRVDPVLSHHTPQEKQPAAVPELSNDQPHQSPGKVMLKNILNKLKPQAEKIIAEEQAGFKAGGSSTEQIFNLRILYEKYLQHSKTNFVTLTQF